MGRLKEPHHGKEDYPVFIDALEDQNPVPSRSQGLGGRQDTAGITCGAVCGLSGASSLPEEVKARSAATKKLSYAVVFCLVFMALEIVGGIYANSLAILSDAAHLLSDVAGFAVSLFAIWASSWEATPRQTFGFHRLEILGALVSIQIIWLITGILVYEAVDRLLNNSKEVDGRLMFIIASFGLVVNLMMICILGHDHTHGHTHDHGHKDHDHNNDHDHDHNGGHKHNHHDHEDHAHSHDHEDHGSDVVASDVEVPLLRHLHGQHDGNEDTVVINRITEDSEGCCKTVDCDLHRHKDNINVRGAYLHVFGDLIQSIGVMVGGAVIWYRPDLKIIDLICTLLFSVLVLGTTVKMVRDILEVLMESTPREIDKTVLEKRLLEDIPEVVAVHELHIWAITVGKTLLACHVKVKPNCDTDDVLAKVIDFCERVYRINHVTIQIERDLTA